jgi:hypothetical protein
MIVAGAFSAALFMAFYCVISSAPSAAAQGITNEAKDRIALVEPTFTYAAYQNGSFYNFYVKYGRVTPAGVDVTTDLQLLAEKPIPAGPFIHYKAPEKGPTIPHSVYHRHVEEHIRAFAPEANITKMGDQHVHKGLIFNQNGSNAYDLLVLFHNEYLSQAEYDNLRRFVENGGTILFSMANVLYAEVLYNESTNSITLVKGHDWEFDGKAARKSVSERWEEETRVWTGSNFMTIPTRVNITFANNPFNYTHTEEQFVANPNVRILYDYQADNPADPAFNYTVASYEMNYGVGKVITVGLFANTLVSDPAYWAFFDNIILAHAILPAFDRVTTFQAASDMPNHSIYWQADTAAIKDVIVDARTNSMHISLERTTAAEDALIVLLPKELLPATPSDLRVEINGVLVSHEMIECDSELSLSLPLSSQADQVRVYSERQQTVA